MSDSAPNIDAWYAAFDVKAGETRYLGRWNDEGLVSSIDPSPVGVVLRLTA